MFSFWQKKKQEERTQISERGANVSNKDIQDVTHDLYKQNLDLAIRNKALSLLSRLYKISILTLSPDDLSKRVAQAVRESLEFEFAGIFLIDTKSDSLIESGAAYSKRFEDVLVKNNSKIIGSIIHDLSIRDFYKTVVEERVQLLKVQPYKVLSNFFSEKTVNELITTAHIRTAIVSPLSIEDRVLGVLVLSFNREYDSLPEFEKTMIEDISNVISLALDKSLVYKELQIANEKLKSLDQLKTEFLSLASHQLRSPITAIKGYTSMLLEGSYGEITDEGQKMAMNRVFQSTINLAQVVEDLLDVSKIEQGGMVYMMQDVDLAKLLDGLVNEQKVSAKNKGLTLNYEAGAKECIVNADPVKMRQVFTNYIDNALKYTQAGEVKVTLTCDTEHKKALIAVKDSGMGIPPEIMNKLFAKFERGEGGKVNAGGSGLGLYLAKEIIAGHKGRTWAESEGRDKGSTFFVELDLR